MSNTAANEIQVGGDHYKQGQRAEYQHWDMAIDLKLPYLEGVATKYLDRHGSKNGRQDLEKAIHYTQKLREAACDGRAIPIQAKLTRAHPDDVLARYFGCRPEMSEDDREATRLIVTWGGTGDLDLAISAIWRSIISSYGG